MKDSKIILFTVDKDFSDSFTYLDFITGFHIDTAEIGIYGEIITMTSLDKTKIWVLWENRSKLLRIFSATVAGYQPPHLTPNTFSRTEADWDSNQGPCAILFLLLAFVRFLKAIAHAYSKVLLARIPQQYEVNAKTVYGRIQAVLDYISGMTDIYALDLYQKINGTSLPVL